MTLDGAVAVLAALGAAAAFALATVAMHHSTAHDTGDVGVARTAVHSRLWWSGIALNGLAYLLQAVSLAFGPLVLVQPLLVLTLVFALPIGARVAGLRLSRSTWCWSVVLVVSLAVFVVGVVGSDAPDREPRMGAAPVVVVVAVAALAGAWVARRRTGVGRAVSLAAVAGLLAGVHAVLTKVVVDDLGSGWVRTLIGPAFITLFVIGLVSLWVRQLAFQAGWLHTSVPTMVVSEPVVAATLGVLVLGERVRESGPALMVLVLTVVVMAVATVVLARTEALVARVAG